MFTGNGCLHVYPLYLQERYFFKAVYNMFQSVVKTTPPPLPSKEHPKIRAVRASEDEPTTLGSERTRIILLRLRDSSNSSKHRPLTLPNDLHQVYIENAQTQHLTTVSLDFIDLLALVEFDLHLALQFDLHLAPESCHRQAVLWALANKLEFAVAVELNLGMAKGCIASAFVVI